MEIMGIDLMKKCSCKIEFGKHYPHLLPLKENFIKYIKDKCNWCSNNIEGTWEWYLERGNACAKCYSIGSKWTNYSKNDLVSKKSQ